MMRRVLFSLGLAVSFALPVLVRADRDPRAALTAGFADQRAVVDRAATTVGAKLAEAATTRIARARAAYKLLRADAAGIEVEPALAIARRRAAARWLLARDRAELWLLAEEARQLLTARQRVDGDAARAATIPLPAGLVWPVRGTVARGFGPFTHERSGAVLTRRGVDLEVDADADVVAPAAGTVRYAGPIRGLDDGVVLDHGGFLTIIAKLALPSVKAGDQVAQGAVLGRPARYRVYVEVRVQVGPGGTPIDPTTVFPQR